MSAVKNNNGLEILSTGYDSHFITENALQALAESAKRNRNLLLFSLEAYHFEQFVKISFDNLSQIPLGMATAIFGYLDKRHKDHPACVLSVLPIDLLKIILVNSCPSTDPEIILDTHFDDDFYTRKIHYIDRLFASVENIIEQRHNNHPHNFSIGCTLS